MLFALLFSASPESAGSEAPSTDPKRAGGEETSVSGLAGWHRGPVRYLLSRREEKEFRSLENDTERLLFVRDFWKARDPDPTTPENEARLSFWQRVADATKLFLNDSTRPGWLTDRGRIYVLLGPPTDIQKDTNFKVGSGASERRGLLRWIYQGRLATGPHVAAFVVAFVPDETGEWRVTNDARLSSASFDPLAAKSYESSPLSARIQSSRVSDVADLGVALDLARVTAPPADDKNLIDTISSETFFEGVPVSVRWDFYPGTGDGRTLAIITAFLPRSGLTIPRAGGQPRALILGRLEREDGLTLDLGEGAFAPLPEGLAPERDLMYQAKTLVAPGSFSSYVGVFDLTTYRAGSSRGSIVVPEFALDRPAIGSIMPARRIEPVSRRSEAGFTLPFVIGELRVIPREKPSYSVGEEFVVYFQLVSPRTQPVARMETRIYRREGTDLVPVSNARITPDPQPAQGWSFPLKDWPAGSYRLVIDVVASGEAETVTREFDFEVTAKP